MLETIADKDLIIDEVENTILQRITFEDKDIEEHTFENCEFVSCIFSNCSLLDSTFRDCVFHGCQFTLVMVKNTTFADVEFSSCKLIGINFTECNNLCLSMSFTETILDSVVLFEKRLKKTRFNKCTIRNTDFDNCDLWNSQFIETKFDTTSFHNCNLEKCDFKTASGYQIDPTTNKLKNAEFTLPEAYSFLLFLGIKIVE